ncbi:unnamed protein product [Diatraea saccharalis]|uniref:Uncharacterized protein n=1 Tax=Diatraea saccharalis TaxID=40085 RepID=A0A9P0G198_9NEOP|nr:unnamed protein product [Diatraea saccharalis]
MVERRGRDISGKWIYLCYPCAAVCSGESILQTHISGKKHKTKLAMKNIWPTNIFEEHPYILSEKGAAKEKGGATATVLQKMAEEVNYHNNPSDLEIKYNKYRNVRCHIQDSLDACKTPLVGVEYLVEHPPEEAHYEPSYICTLCSKQGHPRTIINHMTCFWHRFNYIVRHFPKASELLLPYRSQQKYREGVAVIMNRFAKRIEDKFGRLMPVNIEKEEYEKEKDRIHQWLFKGPHCCEKEDCTLEEVVDKDLIESLSTKSERDGSKSFPNRKDDKRDPSPPIVAAPTKPMFNSYTRFAGRQERRAGSPGVLSDISDDLEPRRERPYNRNNNLQQNRFEPYRDKRQERSPGRMRYTNKAATKDKSQEKQKPHNYEYKIKLVEGQRRNAEEAAKKTLAYHEKNPEKHPLYPEEWKKFWNRRYKEIQADGKDPSKHDFKPEWIVFWTARMKELHEEELRVQVSEIYRKMRLTPPDTKLAPEPKTNVADAKPRFPELKRRSTERARSPDPRRRSPDPRRRSPDPRRRSPEPRRRSPDPRRRSPEQMRWSPGPRHAEIRHRSPLPRRRSPEPRRRTPEPRRRSPDPRKQPPLRRPDDRYRRDYRSPGRMRANERDISPPRVHSNKTRSRSPVQRSQGRGSGSPLSRRDAVEPLRNRSRTPERNASVAPSMQTVLISDDELKPDDGLSPWNSDNDMDSILSMPDVRSPALMSRAGSEMSRTSRHKREYSRPAQPSDLGPAENVVATLRLLVALEDYLGSIGPKLVDLLTEALRMEKEKGNSSEELLDRDSAVVLMETAKEKLKGAVQAGLVPSAASAAVRSAVVRTAATLHAADTRARARNKEKMAKPKPDANPVPVAGVGEVDRAQIAQQMAAALIAQGKTDVSSEELAQLVDAVVGMAEAKKRESDLKKVEARPVAPVKAAPAQLKSSQTSALQLLQSAYDENDKRIEKEEVTDAMDGLSDSDLETLLKNFNELSAEEQHSLIAYLKKLEAREPERVERLRQYVSSAATVTSAAAATPDKPADDVNTVSIESDDDDYTVEEVFQSATQKVKEDQIRQEMEIVKKSLEESKTVTAPTETKQNPVVDLTKNLSSATDLLAFMQASIQSASAPAAQQAADVVTSNTQPRSFGDLPEAPMAVQEPGKSLLSTPLIAQPPFNQGLLRTPQNIMNYEGNNQNADNSWNQTPQTIGNYAQDGGSQMHDNRNIQKQDNRGNFSQDNRPPLLQNNRAPLLQDNRGGHFQQGNRGPYQQDNMQDNRGPQQGNRGPFMDNRGPYGQDNRNMQMQSNRQFPMQNNRGPNMQNNPPLLQSNPPLLQNNPPLLQNNPSLLQSNQQHFGQNQPMQDNRGGSFMQDNRGMPQRGFDNNFRQDSYNQGPRPNFSNGRMQDKNFDTRQQDQQQFGNQKNFRGRGGGRGQHGGQMRGRGRGGFYQK